MSLTGPASGFTLFFPGNDESFVGYSLTGQRARLCVVVSKKIGKCTCKASSLRGVCEHLEAVSNYNLVTYGRGTWEEEAHEITEHSIIIRENGASGKCGVISPHVGDLKLPSLYRLFTEGVTGVEPKGGSILQPKRIRAACEASYKSKSGLLDGFVITAGDGIEYEDYLSDASDFTVLERIKPVETAWRKLERPDPKKFFVSDEVWQQALFAVFEGENILFTGPSGSGKSEFCRILAEIAGIPYSPFNMGAMSEPRTSLIGNTHLSKEGTFFEESRFVKAVRDEGRHLILLDEITRSERGAFNILLPLMDGQRYLSLDEAMDSPVIKRGEQVAFWATANVGMIYTGTSQLDKALKDRFPTIVEMTWPEKEAEEKILVNRTGVSILSAKKLVAVANKQRELAKSGDFQEEISTRMLLAASKRIAAGMHISAVLEFCVLNHFSSEGEAESDRSKVRQICQKTV